MSDDDSLISKSQVKAMFGVDARSITNWQKRQHDPLPIRVKGKRGQSHQYDIHDVHEWGVRQQLVKAGVGEDGEIYDLNHERARLAHHQADKTELETQQLDGKLVPIDLVEQEWSSMFTALRSRLLALPTRLAQVCVASGGTMREVENAAREDIYTALNDVITDVELEIDDSEEGEGSLTVETPTAA